MTCLSENGIKIYNVMHSIRTTAMYKNIGLSLIEDHEPRKNSNPPSHSSQ